MAVKTDLTYKISWLVDCTVRGYWNFFEISYVLHQDFYPVVILTHFLRLVGIWRQQVFYISRSHHCFPRDIITSSSTKVSKQHAQSLIVDQVTNNWGSSQQQISAFHNLKHVAFLNLKVTLSFWTNFLSERWCERQQ